MTRRPDPVAQALDRLADAVENLNDTRERQAQRERIDRIAREGSPYLRRGFEYDALDRRVPRNPINAIALARIPGFIERFDKRVPDDRLSFEDGRAHVRCHCGQTHTMRLAEIAGGECGRYFIFDGDAVRVAPPSEGVVPAES